MQNVLDQAALLKLCDEAVAHFESSKGLLQTVLLETARHIAEHGNWKVCNTVQTKIQASDRNLSHEWEACRLWLCKYVGMEYNLDDKEFSGFKGQKFIRDNYKECEKNPYWKKITVAKPFEFILDEDIRKVIRKANNAMKKAAKDENANVVINYEHLEMLKVMMGMLNPEGKPELKVA